MLGIGFGFGGVLRCDTLGECPFIWNGGWDRQVPNISLPRLREGLYGLR